MSDGRKAATPGGRRRFSTSDQQKLITLLTVVMSGCWVVYLRLTHPGANSDLAPVVFGAQAWLRGQDPYQAVAQSQAWTGGLLYPFTAVLALTPLAWLPPVLLHVLWVTASAGFLAWIISADGFTPRTALLISPAMLHSVITSQWSPLLLAASLTTWGGFILACKPTTALWLFAYRPQWRHVVGSLALLAVSLLLWPSWPVHWRAELSKAVNTTWPLALPGAALVLLALIRWREPRARLLVAMACVPHTTLMYETLPLFLIPRTWLEAGLLCLGSLVAIWIHNASGPYADAADWARSSARLIVWFMYLPALVMVLRPHEGAVRRPLMTRAFERDLKESQRAA